MTAVSTLLSMGNSSVLELQGTRYQQASINGCRLGNEGDWPGQDFVRGLPDQQGGL